jgi:hypothetical protein
MQHLLLCLSLIHLSFELGHLLLGEMGRFGLCERSGCEGELAVV